MTTMTAAQALEEAAKHYDIRDWMQFTGKDTARFLRALASRVQEQPSAREVAEKCADIAAGCIQSAGLAVAISRIRALASRLAEQEQNNAAGQAIGDGWHCVYCKAPLPTFHGFCVKCDRGSKPAAAPSAPKEKEQLTAADYEEVLADHRRLVREIDALLNGGVAAKQASLCDLVPQIKALVSATTPRGWVVAIEVSGEMVVYGPQYLTLSAAERDAALPRARGQKTEIWACVPIDGSAKREGKDVR